MKDQWTERTEQSGRRTEPCAEIGIPPKEERQLQPIVPGAFETVAALCREAHQKRYGNAAPKEAQARLAYELGQLQSRERDSSVLLIVHRLVQGLREKGYLLAARGSLPSFYTAYLLGVTQTDPLALRVPHETLWEQENRLCCSDFNVSEECWEDAEKLLAQIFPQGKTVCAQYPEARGGGAGFSETAVDAGGFYPYARFLVPDTAALQRRTSVQKRDGHDTIPYKFGLFHGMFRLILLPTQTMGLLHRLEELTGTPQSSICAQEAVPVLVQDPTGIPEFGEPAIQSLWELARPETMEGIIKVSALAHGSGAWLGNADELLRAGTAALGEIIASREDVFDCVTDAGLDRAFACRIMERVRRGKGLEEEHIAALRKAGAPEWFPGSCKKIRYLFPKAHCTEAVVVPALRAAWYKAHFPQEYAQAYAELHME